MIRFRKAWKILGICLVLLVCSCSGKDKSKHINYRLSGENELLEALSALKEAPDDVTLNISIWYYFTERGMWDSVIRYAAPVFHRTLFSPEKEQLMLYSGAYASQAFIFSERFDSLGTYLDRIIPISEEKGDDFLRAMVNNIAGLYAIKITGDYAEALERYKQALQAVQNTRDTINQSILLGNIASIYYHRRDTAGYRYASEAYRLARLSTDHYSMTYSALQLSQMLYLKKEYASAAAYMEEVAGIATGYPQFHAQFHLLQANMYADRGVPTKPRRYCSRGSRFPTASEASNTSTNCFLPFPNSPPLPAGRTKPLNTIKSTTDTPKNSSESRKKEHSRDLRTKKSVQPLKTK